MLFPWLCQVIHSAVAGGVDNGGGSFTEGVIC